MQYRLFVNEKTQEIENNSIEKREAEKLTPKQIIYRNYLKSATWKHIREEALRYYKGICQGCGGEGRDVHHMHYPEEWGQETIYDLKVLCRKCHNIEHSPTPVNQETSPKMERIHVRAISSFLSEENTKEMQKEYPDKDLHTLFISDTEEGAIARQKAIKLLNIQEFFNHGGKKFSTAYGLYDFVVKKEMEEDSNKIKQLRKQQEENKRREAQRQADRQRNWKKTLEEHNPRLYRKLEK